MTTCHATIISFRARSHKVWGRHFKAGFGGFDPRRALQIAALLALSACLHGCVFVVMGAMAVYGVSKAVHEAEYCEKAEDRC